MEQPIMTTLANFIEISPSWEASTYAGTQELPSISFEPKGSLFSFQKSSTCPYPETDKFSQYNPILSFQDQF
jgi:hypothetical protein